MLFSNQFRFIRSIQPAGRCFWGKRITIISRNSWGNYSDSFLNQIRFLINEGLKEIVINLDKFLFWGKRICRNLS